LAKIHGKTELSKKQANYEGYLLCLNILKTYFFLLVMFSCCLISVQVFAQNDASTANLSQLIQMAEGGDADAQVDLALKYEKGKGVPQDLE
jgi:TPR repeat protein